MQTSPNLFPILDTIRIDGVVRHAVEGKDVYTWLEVKAQLKEATRNNGRGACGLRRDEELLNQHHESIFP